MSLRRAFKAKVLSHEDGEFAGEVLTFGEDDSPKFIDLRDPFVCLAFVEEQVRKRTSFETIEDFEVTMQTLSSEGSGLVTENDVVRPWRYPDSAFKYLKA